MKVLRAISIIYLIGVHTIAVQARPDDDQSVSERDRQTFDTSRTNASFFERFEIYQDRILSLNLYPVIEGTSDWLLPGNDDLHGDMSVSKSSDPVAGYETHVPHKTRSKISRFEKRILTAYLDNTNNTTLAEYLAIYHLNRSLLRKSGGEAVKHTIIAEYFLNRSLDLGNQHRWIRNALERTDIKLNRLISHGAASNDSSADAEEDHAAHEYFRTAFFNNHEENRYVAVEMLLDDFA
jgi:hypothetical protein